MCFIFVFTMLVCIFNLIVRCWMCVIIHTHNIRSFGPDLIIAFDPGLHEFNIFALTYHSKSLVLLLCFGVKPLFLLCLTVCVFSVRVHDRVRPRPCRCVCCCLSVVLCSVACFVLYCDVRLLCCVTCDVMCVLCFAVMCVVSDWA